MANFSKRSLDNLQGVHPDMVKIMMEAIKHTPIDFTITEGVRSKERQQTLYSYGRTRINPDTGKMTKVTNVDGVNSKSNHQIKSDGYGHAVDIYPYINGSVRTEGYSKEVKQLADHIQCVANTLGIKIRRGIDWKSPYDPPHFELA